MGAGSTGKMRPMVIRIIRVLLFSFLGFLALLLILTGYFYLDRDNISKHLLLSSTIIPGESSVLRALLSTHSFSFPVFHC